MKDLLISFLDWLKDMLTELLVTILDAITSALLSILDGVLMLCPLCSPAGLINSFESSLNAVPGPVIWMLGWLRLDYGIPLIAGAYLVRFLIRRIPVIG